MVGHLGSLGLFFAALLLAGPLPAADVGPSPSCPCLENGGQPGRGGCPCDVGQCYHRCVEQLCPDTPYCTLECSRRCTCYTGPPECPSHEDPGGTPTPIRPTPTEGATPSGPSRAACAGDCDADGTVSIAELIAAVQVSLHGGPAECVDLDGDGEAVIHELIRAVGHALHGCPATPSPTPTGSLTVEPTISSVPTATPTPTGPATTDEVVQLLEPGLADLCGSVEWSVDGGPDEYDLRCETVGHRTSAHRSEERV